MDTLFQPYRLNASLTLANRFMMAPLTRCMAGPGLVPTEQMAAYYGRRADIGLIISEATIIRPDGQGYPDTPGLYSAEQIAGWKKVTSAVHAKGGKIFAQLWHVGRVSHSFFHGQQPVAPSAIGLEGTLPRMRELSYPVPRALTVDEIVELTEQYAQAAANAMAAGFDGVEIHGANGYLIDQFLHHASNLRDDQYGQTPENMSRFALEVVDAVNARIGGDRVGLRLSPGAYAHMEGDARDRAVFDYLLGELNQRTLAYLHLGIFDDSLTFDYLGGRASDYLREQYDGHLVGVGNYSAETAAEAIKADRFDLIAIGRPLIANPDYLARVKKSEPLVPYSDTMLAELV
ncbi:alkene reductase [Aeromonas sp. BIGb0445]|uniref:alkene reductase n=1 Tax=Aeromonas sp. BIGb0445 TaxID=2940593 RepID=UPI00216705B3|nr:alkene reductase [Aeromonas sp. BIGb0445]MCS3460664.1 2,4-dienoyl-CoA reductase-like NADH-dependent reductase (Old Yellow Enzyme family) [Aeromonas sp. BIGb0445]